MRKAIRRFRKTARTTTTTAIRTRRRRRRRKVTATRKQKCSACSLFNYNKFHEFEINK